MSFFENCFTDTQQSNNYPVRIEAGQVFAVEYLLSDGSTEWRYYRSDGTMQDGQLITMRIKME